MNITPCIFEWYVLSEIGWQASYFFYWLTSTAQFMSRSIAPLVDEYTVINLTIQFTYTH